MKKTDTGEAKEGPICFVTYGLYNKSPLFNDSAILNQLTCWMYKISFYIIDFCHPRRKIYQSLTPHIYIYLFKLKPYLTCNLLPDNYDDQDDKKTDNSACDNTLLVHSSNHLLQCTRSSIDCHISPLQSIS